MSALRIQLTEDMKQAMRDHDTLKLGAIRFLLSEIKNWEIDHGEQDNAGIIAIISREVKKNKDALADFEKAGRTDLVEEETIKLKVLESYLPKQLSDDELRSVVQEVVNQSEGKDFGTVMKSVMAKIRGQADGNRVSSMVKEILAA